MDLLGVDDVDGLSVVVLREDVLYVGDEWTVLSYLDVLACVQHRDPVGSGRNQRVGMVVGHQLYL